MTHTVPKKKKKKLTKHKFSEELHTNKNRKSEKHMMHYSYIQDNEVTDKTRRDSSNYNYSNKTYLEYQDKRESCTEDVPVVSCKLILLLMVRGITEI